MKLRRLMQPSKQAQDHAKGRSIPHRGMAVGVLEAPDVERGHLLFCLAP
jgi:hypothetical protein